MMTLRGALALCSVAALVGAVDVGNVVVSDAQREVDISTQIVWSKTTFEAENKGAAGAPFVHVVPAADAERLAAIDAQVDGKDVKLVKMPNANGFAYYKIDAKLPAGGKTSIVVNELFTTLLTPHPREIAQADSQFVVYNGNAHVLSPYAITRSKTTVKLAQGKLEAHTKVAPSEVGDSKITYGAYDNLAPLSVAPVRIHSENYTPFLTVRNLERTIEVSHWGNIAVEESIELEHVGARLNGPFSRYDFQRDPRQDRMPAVNGFRTLLPASARDVYYRDEIGNISTSHMRIKDDTVELAIRPRFPLFGGWRTNYVLGYNVPSYEYLFSKGRDFALRMRFVDHIFDNMHVESATLKVILPENIGDVRLLPPYAVERSADKVHKTYLDTHGRTVIIAHKHNLVEKHIANFELHYTFDRSSMLREPAMLIAAFMCIFAAVIIWVRFDFTIAHDPAAEQQAKAAAQAERTAEVVASSSRSAAVRS